MSALPLTTEQFNRMMIRLTEHFDPVIREKRVEIKSVFRDLIPKGEFKLGEGYVRKVHTFHAGLDDQAGLTRWTAIQSYRAAGTNSPTDPGFDPCKYTAHLINYGFQTEQYSGYETSRRSPDYCIRDFMWDWQFKQQLEMIINSFGDTTLQVWDNFGREMYINFATKLVLTGSLDNTLFTYSPLTSTKITVPSGTVISTLSQRHLDNMYQLLALQCPKGAIAQQDGQPVFGLVIHPFDWDDMLHRDSSLRADFRDADPNILVDGVGKFKTFRGFSHMNDLMTPRFSLTGRNAAGDLEFERVLPYVNEAVTQGERWNPDPDYIKAEYAMGIMILKDVYEQQIPPATPGRIAGADFGTTPPNNGQFEWINIRDRENNLLGEKGFFFGRYTGFAKPLPNHEYAIAFLYKRCPNAPIVLCETCADATSGAKSVTQAVAVDPTGSGSYFQVKVTISDANGLTCEANQAVTVTYVDGTTQAALIADDGNAPTEYTLTFPTAAAWVTVNGGITSVTCA